MLHYFSGLKCWMVLLVVVSTAGCTTKADFEEKLQSWYMNTEDSLIQSWGPPDQFYKSGEARYLTYIQAGSVTMPGSDPTCTSYEDILGNIETNCTGGSAPTTMAFKCKITFTVRSNLIRKWRYEGNNCHSGF
jgi:hypothetical protein